MKKALRVGYNQYYKDDIFAKHLSYVKENSSVIDEIALFAEFSHYGYWNLEFSKENASLMKDRIKQYREAGIKSVGINILCTMGHTDENWGVLPRAPLTYKVSEDGSESKSCLCPANEDFLEHTAKRYALYSDTGADFIWMDDDMNVGIRACFCDGCIEDFNNENHTSFSREELVKQIHSDLQIKQAWEKRKSRVMLTLFEKIKESVHKTNPNVEIGYMANYNNTNKEWITKSGAKKFRPGGGFYKDEYPYELFEKGFLVQYQITQCPENIQDIQYEYEAFNYQTLERSMQLSELESSLAIMSGCTGVLYNDNIFYDSPQTARMLNNSADKWNTLSRVNASCTPSGIYCKGDMKLSRIFNEISIPITQHFENSVAAIILGNTLKTMTDSEIQKVLEKNLLTDGRGLEVLHNKGFGDLCGGKVKSIYDNGMAERFSNHPINGEYKQHYRDVFMNFRYIYNNNYNAYEMEPGADAEVLSNLETTTHIPLGCSMYRFESSSGARFVADGYLIPTSIKSAPKRDQLGNLLDWLSENKLPVRIKKSIKIMPTVTTDSNGGMNIMLTNASFDPSGSFECIVRSNSEFRVIGKKGELLSISQTRTGEETTIMIENIPSWDYVLLTNKS